MYYSCPKPPSIRKFTLDIGYLSESDEPYARTWISTAVKRNVQEISLVYLWSGPEVKLPRCLFSCQTLVSLELSRGIFVDVPATVHLPCLRILELDRVYYANDDTLRRLFSSCPVLEDLTIIRTCDDDNIIVLDVNVPSLKRITVERYDCDDITGKRKVLITAPMLEKINMKDQIFWEFLTEDVSNVVEAIIEVFAKWSNIEHPLFNLLEKMANNVRFLSFSKFTTWPVCLSKAEYPVLRNLVRLEMGYACPYFYTLLALLECSDNLKILVFQTSFHYHTECTCDRELEE